MNINSVKGAYQVWDTLPTRESVSRNPEIEKRQLEKTTETVQSEKTKVVQDKIPPDVLSVIENKSKTRMQFDLDEARKPVVKFTDRETGEVVYQVPSEQLVKQSERFNQYLKRVQDDILDSKFDLPMGSLVNLRV